MKINIEKAKEEFLKYTENYDLTDGKLKYKQEHSLKVMEVSRQIAQGLQLSEDEIELATLIGLLHDIARFEQYKQYGTFKDLQSIDHGDYALVILEKDIRKYIETDEYDDIIKKAIKNHNKYKIEEGLNEKEELFAKIVRDADKMDILYESAEVFWKGEEYKVEETKISPNIFEQFKNKVQIKREKDRRVSYLEEIVFIIAFIFDINFKTSFEIIKKEDYINKILNRYKIKDEFSKNAIEKIKTISNEFINEKIKN